MSGHERRKERGLSGKRGEVVCDCGRTCYAQISKDTGVCGLCAGMDEMQPRDITDLKELGVLA